jgi:hypothetical protein
LNGLDIGWILVAELQDFLNWLMASPQLCICLIAVVNQSMMIVALTKLIPRQEHSLFVFFLPLGGFGYGRESAFWMAHLLCTHRSEGVSRSVRLL